MRQFPVLETAPNMLTRRTFPHFWETIERRIIELPHRFQPQPCAQKCAQNFLKRMVPTYFGIFKVRGLVGISSVQLLNYRPRY